MSNYTAFTKRPHAKKAEVAVWLDDYYGTHKYGVRFPDGKIYPANKCRFVRYCKPEEQNDE